MAKFDNIIKKFEKEMNDKFFFDFNFNLSGKRFEISISWVNDNLTMNPDNYKDYVVFDMCDNKEHLLRDYIGEVNWISIGNGYSRPTHNISMSKIKDLIIESLERSGINL